jgi:putative nucleotidyltransferase with HDIG domain
MRLMPTARVPDGAVLGRDIWTGHNTSIPLLRAGSKMTPRYREALLAAGLRAVYVDDAISAGIDIKQPLREQVRREAIATVTKTFADIRAAVEEGAVVDPELAGRLSTVAETLAREIAACDDVAMVFGDLAAADAYTFQHSIHVATLGMVLAHRTLRRHGWLDASGRRRFDRLDQRLARVGLGLLLHDIGKMTIPSDVLNKPGALDEHEWELIRRHPVAGVELLRGASLSPLITVVIRSHHERWDGAGYPDGKRADEIHDFARLAAVADVFDAVTSERPYRAAMPAATGVSVIAEGRGTAFDPDCVDVFLETVAPYPPGTQVVLSDGREAIVAEVPERGLDRPLVRLLPGPDDDEAGGPAVEIALAEHPQLSIAAAAALDAASLAA